MPSAPPTPWNAQVPAVPQSAPGQSGVTASGRLVTWFSQVRPDTRSAKAAAVSALSALGSQLGLLFVVLAIAAQFLPEDNTGTVGDWLTSTVWLAGLALRGTLGLTVEGVGNPNRAAASVTRCPGISPVRGRSASPCS